MCALWWILYSILETIEFCGENHYFKLFIAIQHKFLMNEILGLLIIEIKNGFIVLPTKREKKNTHGGNIYVFGVVYSLLKKWLYRHPVKWTWRKHFFWLVRKIGYCMSVKSAKTTLFNINIAKTWIAMC